MRGGTNLGHPAQAGAFTVWEEGRPAEAGRVALVASQAGRDGTGLSRDLLPAGFSARSAVHEYGGRAWAVAPDAAMVVTSNHADQRLWAVRASGETWPLTAEPPEPAAVRFVEPVLTHGGEAVIAVRERHLSAEVVNDIVLLPLVGPSGPPGQAVVLAAGHDFYSSPALSPDGQEVAFVTWDHPEMPWDRSQLWRARLSGGRLSGVRLVAGESGDESVLQPRWSPDGRLAYISDRTGWWNIYSQGRNLAPVEAEFAGPPWSLGDSDYAFWPDGSVVATWRTGGGAQLGLLSSSGPEPMRLGYSAFWHLTMAAGPGGPAVLCVAGGPDRAPELVRVTRRGTWEVLRRSRSAELSEDWVSRGRHVIFPTSGGEQAHAVFYPPRNPGFEGPPDAPPPLVVTSHGGPTGNASTVLELRNQYWTSRGLAVVDVDYRGSSGYGRAYRQALEGRWGAADADDCAAAVEFLARRGWADPGRVVVRGSSASGLTVFNVLARHHGFAAGAVRYGVADLAVLAASSHKFESHYVPRLIPADQLVARSPLQLADRVRCPVLLLHGSGDTVVPPDQSRRMAAALRRAGTPVALVEVEGEGHGFRRAGTLVRAQELELAFFARALGFGPADDLSRAQADLTAAAGATGAWWAAR